MILDLVKGTEWETLTQYLSPSFFDVVPFLGITKQVGSLVRKATDTRTFSQVRKAHWNSHQRLEHISGKNGTPAPVTLVKMFFSELHLFPETILDLRANTFSEKEWRPAPLWVVWDTGFISSVRMLYKGFYTDDGPLFNQALKNLDLFHAKEIFIQHFGGDNQRAVIFKLNQFKETFHKVFLSCKQNKATIHPNFLPFGVLLGTLYEHLETAQAGAVNVRQAYESFSERTSDLD